MHHYRQALMRMRQGDSDRDIAKSGLMCRANAAGLRSLAQTQGWLDGAGVLPDDAVIAAALAAPKRASTTISSLECWRDQIAAWHAQGVSGVVILAALKREHGYTQLLGGASPAGDAQAGNAARSHCPPRLCPWGGRSG